MHEKNFGLFFKFFIVNKIFKIKFKIISKLKKKRKIVLNNFWPSSAKSTEKNESEFFAFRA